MATTVNTSTGPQVFTGLDLSTVRQHPTLVLDLTPVGAGGHDLADLPLDVRQTICRSPVGRRQPIDQNRIKLVVSAALSETSR
jgi:hypothetical protein